MEHFRQRQHAESAQDRQDRLENPMTPSRLNINVLNAWQPLMTTLSGESLQGLHPMPTYADYFQDQNPQEFGFILGKSNPESVVKYDAIIRKFNDDIERMKREGDIDAVRAYYADINALVRGNAES